MYILLFCFGTLFAAGTYLILADLLRVPTFAAIRAVLAVTADEKHGKSLDAFIFDLANKLSKFVRIDEFQRRKMTATLKSAGIELTPEVYRATAYVKAGLIFLLVIPMLLIFPLLALVVVFLAIAIYFRETRKADEIVRVKREEIERELPRFVATVAQEIKASRDILSILKAYRKNAGEAMSRELEITIADMTSGNEETALTRWESRIGSPMLSDVIRGLISVKRGDNGVVYFEMLSITFKQLELQNLKLEAMKIPGKVRKYSFMILACFMLMYLGVLGYVALEAFGNIF